MVLRDIARRQLNGVGDARLGQWEEHSPTGVLHLRRRLAVDEQALVGDVLDIRCTPEARARAVRLGPLLARLPYEILAAEIGDAP
jgi:hypothetical protein